ncbi:TPA: DNA-processing protein DprA [Stenotrophomonas maltophilia]
MTEPIHVHALTIFLGLTKVKGIGFKTMKDLGGPIGIAERLESGHLFPLVASLAGVEESALRDFVRQEGRRLLRQLRLNRVAIITRQDELYPLPFRLLPEESQPLWLFYRGNAELVQRPSIAVVGTRDPSKEGEFLTRYATYAMKEFDLPVVSGLALGVDGLAHETALNAAIPNVSILGTGILRPYPARNGWLAEAIVESGGLLISEYFPEADPAADQFVWRNRLQAALAACVIATQWNKSSGTAHTIRFAKTFGRPSINLVPNGLFQPLDHGKADHLFEVPSQHARFMECVYRAIGHWPHGKLALQPSLFG